MLAGGCRCHPLRWPARLGARPVHDFALPDEPRSKLRGPAALTGRAPQDESVAAILDNGLRRASSVRARNLRDRLEPENAAPPEFSQPREGVLESVDLTER